MKLLRIEEKCGCVVLIAENEDISGDELMACLLGVASYIAEGSGLTEKQVLEHAALQAEDDEKVEWVMQ